MSLKELCVTILFVLPQVVYGGRPLIVTTDELENYISEEDLAELMNFSKENGSTDTSGSNEVGSADMDATSAPDQDKGNSTVDCFGMSLFGRIFDMIPDSSDKINTHFYFSSRLSRDRVQVIPGDQFGLEWVDFKTDRKTVMIVHGFMSHSKASWVTDMTNAFLQRGDYNVIAVDWSAGSSTFKYWKAVANTRRVGYDITIFMQQLLNATGARLKDFHFVGHSLGAHIASYASSHLGGVGRITGLDPAQPCFSTSDRTERLDDTDADFVDVIHTNGRHLHKIGLGVPHPIGHADFYPNGGMRQPGCRDDTNAAWYNPARVLQAICSHGRAYVLFTESLLSKNCSFIAHRWNLTYEGVNSSIVAACERRGDCAEMGINAEGGNGFNKAAGPYFVLTTNQPPYCPSEIQRRYPGPDLLRDLLHGFSLTHLLRSTTAASIYADPMAEDRSLHEVATTVKSWFTKWLGRR